MEGRTVELYEARHAVSEELANFLSGYESDISWAQGEPILKIQNFVSTSSEKPSARQSEKVLARTRQRLNDFLSGHGNELTYKQGRKLKQIANSIPEDVSLDSGGE